MGELLYKGTVVVAWVGVLGYSTFAWVCSGIKRGVEEAFNQELQGNPQ